VLAARDALKTTPGMANHMLLCGRSLWNWAIPLDMAENNPFGRSKYSTAVTSHGRNGSPTNVIAQASPDLVKVILAD
jgi:hypothetical protein